MSDVETNETLSQETTTSSESVKYSEQEQAAIDKGWKPKEEYTGDPSRWRSAEVFLAMDEPIKRIEQQSKELKRVTAALDALKQHHSKVKETEYNRALKSLNVQRRQAVVDGEHERAFAIEDQIDQIQKEAAAVLDIQMPPPVQEFSNEFNEWSEKNTWYKENSRMRAAADVIGKELTDRGFSPSEILKMVDKEMRKEFPSKFTNEKASRPSSVEAPTRSGSTGSNSFSLSSEERKIMQKFVDQKVMTEKEYIAELRRMKGQ